MDFIFIANAWDAKQDNPTSKHQIAMELARRGSKILWVEGSGMRRPSIGSGADRSRISGKIRRSFKGPQKVSDNIWILSPLFIPYPASLLVRRINAGICVSAVRKHVKDLGFINPILINYVPVFSETMKLWQKYKSVSEKESGAVSAIYHCVDLWSGFNMYDSALMDKLDTECCKSADVVIASSRALYELCSRKNPRTYEIMHGVDYEHFSAAVNCSQDPLLEFKSRKIIGFVGLLSEWVDQDLILFLAKELEDVQIVLIGRSDVDCDKLKNIPNISILGPRLYKEIPSYISAFSVGIIPFYVNDLTRAVNPIKLREMMAAGCPVVSTDLPEVSDYLGHGKGEYADYVSIAGNREEFADSVKKRLDAPLSRDKRQSLSNKMKSESWPEVVAKLLKVIEKENEDV